jgi:hypothetical protein
MINEPIVVWPPGTFAGVCDGLGNYWDCTEALASQSTDYAYLAAQGAVMCCPV